MYIVVQTQSVIMKTTNLIEKLNVNVVTNHVLIHFPQLYVIIAQKTEKI